MNNATLSAGAPDPQAFPTSISGLISLLYSFSALRDWLKLIVIGSVFEAVRRLAFSTWYSLVQSFYITALFQDGDESYDWMMVWLSKKTAWGTARDLQVSTRSFGLSSNAVLVPGEEETSSSAMAGSRKLAYLPNFSATHHIWYKYRRITVHRSQVDAGYGMKEDRLQISILTRSHSFLNELLLEAKRDYMAAKENSISIYVSDSHNEWRHIATRPKRPLNSIILDPGVKDLLVEDARDFLTSKAWYSDRGIPFRRGYLLYGAPGTGKTSMIHSMAGELGLDIYVISLSRAGLDDTGLNELISNLPEKCIALMEDIDAAFHHGLNREGPDEEDSNAVNNQGVPPSPLETASKTTSRITLSGLLNALDGVGAQEGRILYSTTNKYNALDPALCRPGRMDIHVEFHLASRFQCRELFHRFYNPVNTKIQPEVDCAKADDKSDSDDSTLTDVSDPEEKSEKQSLAPTDRRQGFVLPKLRPGQIKALAKQFAEAIPEREFSTASLQGYLMMYKTRPYQAVSSVRAWVNQELADRLAKKAVTKTASTASPGEKT